MWGIDLSPWWRWLEHLDWSRVNNVLGSIVAITVIAGIAWAAIKFVWKPLYERLGRRRAQSRLLNQLTCGSSVAHIESLTGTALLVASDQEFEQRTYRLPDAWVTIDAIAGRVLSFSVTIMRRATYHNTKRLTRGFIDFDLGRNGFSNSDELCDGEQYWMAAYRWGYARTYYLGRPGAYLRFIVSHNMCGTGGFNPDGPNTSSEISTGAFDANRGTATELQIDATKITANTLTVIHPEAPSEYFLSRIVHGPDDASVAMTPLIRASPYRRLRYKLNLKWYFTKRALRRITASIKRR